MEKAREMGRGKEEEIGNGREKTSERVRELISQETKYGRKWIIGHCPIREKVKRRKKRR